MQQQALPRQDPRRAGPAAATAPRHAAAVTTDPFTIVHVFAAWMPENIAANKLRGFVHDAGGEVVESVPGRIRVRLGGKGSIYGATGLGSWFGIGRRSSHIDVELQLQKADPSRDSLLRITVVLRPAETSSASPDWRDRCAQIFCDLRGYLMGQANG